MAAHVTEYMRAIDHAVSHDTPSRSHPHTLKQNHAHLKHSTAQHMPNQNMISIIETYAKPAFALPHTSTDGWNAHQTKLKHT